MRGRVKRLISPIKYGKMQLPTGNYHKQAVTIKGGKEFAYRDIIISLLYTIYFPF